MKNTIDQKVPFPPAVISDIDTLIHRALQEDIDSGDVTTDSIIREDAKAQATWKAKQDGVIAGLFIGEKIFHSLDHNIQWQPQVEEGEAVKAGDRLVKLASSTRSLLTGERTALNFVQRLSGIATKTSKFVEELEGTKTCILDTRKTLPGFRALDKYAVKAGDGKNHRMGLYDMALIKENHITAAGGITQAVKLIRSNNPEVEVEVETTTLSEVEEALSTGADMIMLDNMSNDQMRQAVNFIKDQAKTEASGNIILERLEEVAECGVDYISAGVLTHSVQAFDITQIIEPA